MDTRAKLFGQPAEPMFVMFPLGLLPSAVVFDIVYLTTGRLIWAHAAFWMIVAGIAGALAGALFAALDWFSIPSGTRAKRVGLLHEAANIAVIALFGVSLLLRRSDPALAVTTHTFVVGFLGFIAAVVSGLLGGALVQDLARLGASLRLPESRRVSRLPARTPVRRYRY